VETDVTGDHMMAGSVGFHDYSAAPDRPVFVVPFDDNNQRSAALEGV